MENMRGSVGVLSVTIPNTDSAFGAVRLAAEIAELARSVTAVAAQGALPLIMV